MKSNVTVEELNAATILLTGVPVTQLVEVHIAGAAITAVTSDGAGNLAVSRIAIGIAPEPSVEVEEDDGT